MFSLENNDDIRYIRCANSRREIMNALRECREERRPYVIHTATMNEKPLHRILVPVSMLEEETYKAEICTYLARQTGAKLILMKAHDYGHKAQQNVDKIVTRIRKVSESTGTAIEYEVWEARKDSFRVMREAAERQRDHVSDLIVLTASREYGLDDLIFGPEEYHCIRKAQVPVLLVNPRADLFSLCD